MSLELPSLPHPPHRFAIGVSALGDRLDYSAHDMQAYARQAQRMALEKAAKECEEMQFTDYEGVKLDHGPELDANAVLRMAAAEIRKLAEQL